MTERTRDRVPPAGAPPKADQAAPPTRGRDAGSAAQAARQRGLSGDRGLRMWDLAAAAGLTCASALAAVGLPGGDPLRVLAVAPMALVPGYVFLEAALPPAGDPAPMQRPALASGRAWRLAVALGLTPAVVGLLALATAAFPGGFLPLNIILTITFATLALTGVAGIRRSRGFADLRRAPTARSARPASPRTARPARPEGADVPADSGRTAPGEG